MKKLLDTTCNRCKGDCVLDEEWMNRYPVPKELPIERRIYKCTNCGKKYSHRQMLNLQRRRAENAQQTRSKVDNEAS